MWINPSPHFCNCFISFLIAKPIIWNPQHSATGIEGSNFPEGIKRIVDIPLASLLMFSGYSNRWAAEGGDKQIDIDKLQLAQTVCFSLLERDFKKSE